MKKSLTPDMDGDTIGASIEINTTSAFDRKKPLTAVTLEASYNDATGKTTPKAALDFSRTFGDRWGVAGGLNGGSGRATINGVPIAALSDGNMLKKGDVFRIETGGGDVGVLRAGGDVEVQTGGGDVSLLGCPGQTQVRTGAGDVSVEAEGGSVDVKTGAGDIRITVPRDIPVWQDLHSSFGEVVSRIASRGEPAEGEPFIRVTARTGTGDVVLQD